MCIKTVAHSPNSPNLALCDFWSFPKLKEKPRGYRYERIEKMKEAVTKVIGMLTQEDCQPEEITSKGTRVSCVY